MRPSKSVLSIRTETDSCEKADFDEVDQIVESLGGYGIFQDEAARVNAIIEAADNLDYEMIPEIINGESAAEQ